MALFQKKQDSTENIPLYTLGMNKTALIVGLGNPGKKYDNTRHNIGFASVDTFAKAHDFDPWVEKSDLKSLVTSKTLGDVRVILCKPTAFMNLSGEAVQKVMHFYKTQLSELVVVHDELDIPFGQIRMRIGGSSAGHKGIKSLFQHIGEDFGRVRIGVLGEKPAEMDSADYVLAKFNKDEQSQLSLLTREVNSILTEYVYRGTLEPETRSFLI